MNYTRRSLKPFMNALWIQRLKIGSKPPGYTFPQFNSCCTGYKSVCLFNMQRFRKLSSDSHPSLVNSEFTLLKCNEIVCTKACESCIIWAIQSQSILQQWHDRENRFNSNTIWKSSSSSTVTCRSAFAPLQLIEVHKHDEHIHFLLQGVRQRDKT